MKTVLAAAALASTALIATDANAAYLVQVLGLFNSAAPTTAETAPNLQFTLSLNLPDPFTYTTDSYGGHETQAFSNASYTLNGADAGSGLYRITFFPAGHAYIPDVDFQFTDGVQITLDNVVIEDNGTLTAPSMNTSVTEVAPNGAYTISGNATITVTNVPDSAVPEAATWAMMIAGFGLVGGALRRAKRTALSFA